MSTEIKPATNGLYRKLAEVMQEIGHVQKNGYNIHFKYHYVTEADLIDAVRKSLVSRGVLLIPSVVNSGVEGDVTTAVIEFAFIDSATGETHKSQWLGTGKDPGDKGVYKAYTGALKYFLMKTFLISTGDDPESDSESAGKSQATKAVAQSAPKPQPVRQAPAATTAAGSIDLEIQKAMGRTKKSVAEVNAHVAESFGKTNWKDCSPEEKKRVLDTYLAA